MLNSYSVNEDILIKLNFKIIIWLTTLSEYSCYVHFALYLNMQSVEIPIILVFFVHLLYIFQQHCFAISPLSLMHLCLHSVNFSHYNFKMLTLMVSNCPLVQIVFNWYFSLSIFLPIYHLSGFKGIIWY